MLLLLCVQCINCVFVCDVYRYVYSGCSAATRCVLVCVCLSSAGVGVLEGTCNEKRIFYRIVSGLHTSISVHLCKQWPRQLGGGGGASFAGVDWTWEPNLAEFERRFQPSSNRDGPSFLRNVFFLYLVYVRALAKATPYLLQVRLLLLLALLLLLLLASLCHSILSCPLLLPLPLPLML